MTTKSDYFIMAKWITENSSPDNEWAHIRDPLIAFVCFIAAESDKQHGNQKRFDRDKFLKAIARYDDEAVRPKGEG